MAMPDPILMAGNFQPPDQAERSRALDPTQSFLVQAPAGSGKTYLLTQRFLRLLGQAEKPDEIVAITFTNAAAAEMRNRILDALEKAESSGENSSIHDENPESLPALARRALLRDKRLGWRILDQPSQLRITTIDAFCRGLALQCPMSWGLLSGLGGRLEPVNNPKALYKRAATRIIELLGAADSPTRRSVETLLLWRDNNWKDVEDLIVQMLGQRNRWYQEFVFAREGDWDALRRRLEAVFCRGVRTRLETLSRLLDGLPGCREFALELAQFACGTPGKFSPLALAELAALPTCFDADDGVEESVMLEDAIDAHRNLANFLLTARGEWRKKGGLNVHHGFPSNPDGKVAKERFAEYVESLTQEPGLAAALVHFQGTLPVRYTDAEWELMRHCFAVLRAAAGELQAVFAETGSVDFTEVAQIALRILAPENGFPSDFAIRQADSIRHLLIDEFQDTSRNQHQLLARLIGAWPEREGRSCFCVGDPMQSIYGFREAEVELFERLKTHGLDVISGLDATPFRFEFVSLRANFRTAPTLVDDLNGHFGRIFAEDDGSGVRYSAAEAARKSQSSARTELHLGFTPSTRNFAAKSSYPPHPSIFGEPEQTRQAQLNKIVALIQSKLPEMAAMQAAARENPEVQSDKYRIAVLARTRKSLILIAEALRQASIGFRAIDLVELRERPEVLDALSLVRALLNPVDRTAWLGVLRAPWCGLSLTELYLLTSADDPVVSTTPIPVLMELRLPELFKQGLLDSRAYEAAARVGRVLRSAAETRASAANSALGTWIESVWIALGGEDTVDREQGENIRLLWAALDKLPEGELDLVGQGLPAALDELFALPDPAASSDYGVQLMTIHKSKGLEFEMVIVPDLEAKGKTGERSMISWLERGLANSEAGEELTEFLIAPIQAKGGDAGNAKKWVDSVKRERETQELRRVLYVAATRAREELHLFARPRFRVAQSAAKQGAPTLAKATGLLATAWPALGDAVEVQFSAWLDSLASTEASDVETVGYLAAEAGNLVQMPGAIRKETRPTVLRRLPEGYVAPELPHHGTSARDRDSSGSIDEVHLSDREELYSRTEGGLRSRLEGTAIHALLEELSRLRQKLDAAAAAETLVEALPGVIATMRSRGLPAIAARRLAEDALSVAQRVAVDPVGAWILAPHPEAETETRWTGLVATATGGRQTGRVQQQNLRPDRVFYAGRLSSGLSDASAATGDVLESSVKSDSEVREQGWWIIDYKTSHAGAADLTVAAEAQAFLSAHREQHAGQLAAYAQVLRGLRESGDPKERMKIRTGIYYSRLRLFDFWEA
jgi:ATP-dependent helicase/nuclease subunit A